MVSLCLFGRYGSSYRGFKGRSCVGVVSSSKQPLSNMSISGFDNPKTNVCHVEPPIRLYDEFREGKFYCATTEGEKEGLNPQVLLRVLQMLLRE